MVWIIYNHLRQRIEGVAATREIARDSLTMTYGQLRRIEDTRRDRDTEREAHGSNLLLPTDEAWADSENRIYSIGQHHPMTFAEELMK